MKQIITAATLAALALGASLPAAGQVTVKDAWARGTVAAARSSGAFLRIESKQDARLVDVRTPVATAELHQMAMQDNRMSMARVPAIELPAGKTVELAGPYHIMLMGLKRQLKEGEKVPLTLVIERQDGKRENVEVEAVVKPLTYSPKDNGH